MRRFCAPCPSGCCHVVLVVSMTFGCPWLSPVFFPVPCLGSVLPPRPLLGVWGCLWYTALISAGWGLCLGWWLSFAPCSRWCPLSGWSSLRLRVLGGSWFSLLCSLDRWSTSRSTCPALPPVSGLSFWLGVLSFGGGFGLLLVVLLAPSGCRGTCCYPPWGSASARVLPSLLGPFPSGVCHLSRICSSVGGPVGVLIPSLAPSWWWPFPLLRWALLTLSSYVLSVPSAVFFAVDPVALLPLLPHVFADSFRHWCSFRFGGGASPLALGPVGPLGSCGGSTYFALQRAWLVSAILPWPLELRSVFHTFPA